MFETTHACTTPRTRRGRLPVRAARAALGAAAVATVALLIAALLGAGAPAQAGSSERQGTSGANELRIPVGPRSNAMAGATVGDVVGPEALYWNPAGACAGARTEAYFSHLTYIADMKVNYFAVVTRAGNAGTLGFSAKVLDVGDILVTTEAAPDGTGDIISPTFTTLGVTYSRQFTDRVRFGATGQFVSERIANASAKGVAFDFGFQYDTGYNGLIFGFVMKNFGTSMTYSGPDFEQGVAIPGQEPGSQNRTLVTNNAGFEMPSYFQMAASYDLLHQKENALNVAATFMSNNYSPDEFRGGAEYVYHDQFALRAGYGKRVSDSDRDSYDGFSWGAGLNVKLGQGTRLKFDYANRMVRDWFSDTHEFAARLTF